MKSYIAFFLILFLPINLIAQNGNFELNKLVFCVYLPQNESIPKEGNDLLISKMFQLTTKYGIGGNSNCNSRFYLTCRTNIISKEVIPSSPVNYMLKAQIVFIINDALQNISYNSISKEINGIGSSEQKAYNNLFSKISIVDEKYGEFFKVASDKIIKYYENSCESIIKASVSLKNQGKYDDAIYNLSQVPDISACYDQALQEMGKIYQEKIDKECLLIIRNAKTTWMSNKNAESASKVADILNSISPFSTCEPDASNLINEISSKLAADEKASWEFQIQKHKDAVKLKEEALRIDEEDRKRRSSLQSEAQKQQYALQNDAQKQQYALQKASQKQEYELQKKDQEAVGLRGFVNSIAKLKVSLWRETAQDYVNTQKVDYSKLNFK
jgi:hypothetical protein